MGGGEDNENNGGVDQEEMLRLKEMKVKFKVMIPLPKDTNEDARHRLLRCVVILAWAREEATMGRSPSNRSAQSM